MQKVSSNGFKRSRPWVTIGDFLCPICLFLFLQSPLAVTVVVIVDSMKRNR